MRTLYVAAGGGGDAVGALLARRALGDTDERPALVSTCAWERLRIDPIPGPRARADFTGLGPVGGAAIEVLPDSDTVPTGRSVLPRLAGTGDARIFLHDFGGGAVGLRDQLQQLADAIDADRLVAIDVGGDIVARGSEPNLRSPLADSLTLAAALGTGIPTSVVVLGPGADGELPETQVLGLFETLRAQSIGCVTSEDVQTLAPVLCWHPTEATALVAASARGLRGFVAMRRGREPIPLTGQTPQIWTVLDPTFGSFPLARLLQGTESLYEAEDIMREVSVDEIDFERKVAAVTQSQGSPLGLHGVISDMESVGATHITRRRLSEALGADAAKSLNAAGRPASWGIWSWEELVRIAG